MLVLCLGMPRTGTVSMWTVLNKLGFDDCYYMLNVLKSPPDAYMWIEAVDAKYYGKGRLFEKDDWNQLLRDCQVIVPGLDRALYQIVAAPTKCLCHTVRL